MGQVAEWLKARAWRARRRYPRLVGSNPTLSVHISRKYGEAPPSRFFGGESNAEVGNRDKPARHWRSVRLSLDRFDAGPSAPVLVLRVGSPDSQPTAVGWTAINVAGLPAANKEEHERGIRAMAHIPGAGAQPRHAAVDRQLALNTDRGRWWIPCSSFFVRDAGHTTTPSGTLLWEPVHRTCVLQW